MSSEPETHVAPSVKPVENFLAPSKHATAVLGPTTLDVVTLGFEDKISIMINTNGSISQLFYVPLLAAPVPSHLLGGGGGSYDDDGNFIEDGAAADSDDFMPLAHLTPMPLLGHTGEGLGSIYAAQIASMVARQAPEDRRIVVVGLGPAIGPRPGQDVELEHRKQFLEMIKLVEAARVW